MTRAAPFHWAFALGEREASPGELIRQLASPLECVLFHSQLVDIKGARVEVQKHIVHPGKR